MMFRQVKIQKNLEALLSK